ncbi:hypothetical protein KSP39_PZI019144 [Platanthera zijinensis]|uniref:Uncharacterized protein n=1 Tax=Platanthera zijinensis TaxID=2320716 RepID=A0AAP0B1Z9_9ASPA
MNKPDKHITNIGFSEEVIHYMNPVVFLENPLEDLNGEHQHCASASSHLKEKMFTDVSSSLPGMDTKSLLCYSAPSQRCTKSTKVSAICETSSCTSALSSVHASSDSAKDPEIVISPELANMKDFPTFDLGF